MEDTEQNGVSWSRSALSFPPCHVACRPNHGTGCISILSSSVVASTRLLKQNAMGTSDSHNKVYYNERQGRPIGTNTLDKSAAPNSRGTEFL